MATTPSQPVNEKVNNATASIHQLQREAIALAAEGSQGAAPVTNSSNKTEATTKPATAPARNSSNKTKATTTPATGGRRKRRTHKHRNKRSNKRSRRYKRSKRTRRH